MGILGAVLPKSLVFMAMIAFTSMLGLAQGRPQGRLAVHDAAPARPEQDWWGHHKKKRSYSPQDAGQYKNAVGLPLLKNIAADQKAIWMSTRHLRLRDANWLVPLAGLAAAMLATDSATSRHLSNFPTRIGESRTFSNLGAASLVGVAGSLYLWGKARHNEHMRETGLLSGEAVIDSYLAATAIKTAAGRERPYADNARGRFGQGGSSFPSEHAAAAWSTAGIITHEYPGLLTKLFAYGLAAAVSASRVTSQEHFPSDVLVGSALGWLIAHEVYHQRHSPELWGAGWQIPSHERDREQDRQPGNMGSPYVPLDSWVYPEFDRLAALGYIDTEFLGLRPWTRLECARLVSEASDHLQAEESDAPVAVRLVQDLEGEFSGDLGMLDGARNRSLHLESVYTRFTGISGEPLRDGYHFGQTLINDYGRPYAEGLNEVTGFSGWATSGRFVAYLRGEYQHAPSSPALPLAVRETISAIDARAPLEPGIPFFEVNRFHLLDSYVGMNLGNWQISFGKQSLWWGPGEGGPMLLSDNADPINMFRISRVSPVKLPGPAGWLGPVRTEFFIGQLGGHRYIYGPSGFAPAVGSLPEPQPFIHGEKFSFKPTPNLEFSVSRTTLFAGAGVPFTLHTFLKSAFSLGNGLSGTPSDPGDRRSAVDFTYRVPKFRKWLTFYADGFAEDEISPIGYADRSVWRTGIYVPEIPRFHKLDFRAEGVYTDNPLGGNLGHGFFYYNYRYRSGYTNDGNLLGNWIGRQGQGVQAWTNYWLGPRSRIQFSYRHQKVSREFIPYGGTVNDAGMLLDLWAGSRVSLSANLQYEKWRFPVLAQLPKSNFTTSVQLTFWPQWSLRGGSGGKGF
jgi:membrane-associated phospholipid phosphatase